MDRQCPVPLFVLLILPVLAAGCSESGTVVKDHSAADRSATDQSATDPGNSTAHAAAKNGDSGSRKVHSEPAMRPPETGPEGSPTKLKTRHLPNAVQIHDRVISGGQPDGSAGFRELQELGIRTIISVDGAAPDLALASQYGLKYVHLPHSYDGIPEQRLRELARAVSILEAPIYVHCHHGRHRSPAAAAAACVSAGLIDLSAGRAVLRIAGTSNSYRGLFQSVESARRFEQAVLDAMPTEFPEKVELPPLAEAMVQLERTHDRLKQFAAAGWSELPTHPNTNPTHEALLLKEHFVEMLRMEHDTRGDDSYHRCLAESRDASESLEAALGAWQNDGSAAPVPAQIAASFDRITQRCAACHQKFRDIPLSEKQQHR